LLVFKLDDKCVCCAVLQILSVVLCACQYPSRQS
jgi:hypothetical protein